MATDLDAGAQMRVSLTTAACNGAGDAETDSSTVKRKLQAGQAAGVADDSGGGQHAALGAEGDNEVIVKGAAPSLVARSCVVGSSGSGMTPQG